LKETKVDFEINGETAVNIYTIRDKALENSNTALGLVAVIITFLFGFIGTFISRLFIAKQDIGSVILPTLIHFVITIFVVIPFVGWLIYLGGALYFMIKNYQLVINKSQ
jgi:hypothetical protein